MRTHGWAGDTPADDTEAVARIVRAACAIIDADERDLSISKVAGRLGVTRQTVYRYFPSTDALLKAAANDTTAEFLDGLADALRGITDPTEAVVEGIAVTLERLRANPRFALLFQHSGDGRFVLEVTSEAAVQAGRHIVERFDVDWASHGWGGADLDQLTEHMLRTLQSFILDPGQPPRSGAALRDYLRRWAAPHPPHPGSPRP
ncbi:TetR/AcrR family transcriptional regulator [Nocardia takedensis]